MDLSRKALPGDFPAVYVTGEPGRLRRLTFMALWAPLIFLTGIVHVLCRPLTKRILISTVILDIPLQWGAHFAERTGGAAMGAMDGFDVSITTVALAGLYVGWLFTNCTERHPMRVVWNWSIAAYTGVVCVSLFVASDVQLASYEVFLIVEMFLLYVYLATNIKSRQDLKSIIRLVLIGGIVESAYMLSLVAIGHEVAFIRALGFKSVIYSATAPGEAIRFGGTVGSPNSAAAYLAMVITIALMARYLSDSPRIHRLIAPLLVLGTIALILTLSRGGWIEVVVSGAVLTGAVWLKTGVTSGRVLAFCLAIGIAVALVYVPNPVSARFTDNDNGSALSRVPLMRLAGHMIADNPILGVGANNFSAEMRHYEGPEFRHAWLYTVHNQFLLVWSETGLIGLLAYLWIFVNIIRRGWRLWKGGDALFAPVGLGIVAVAWGLLSHMLVEDFSSRPIIQFVWILAAMIAGSEVIQSRESKSELGADSLQEDSALVV